MAPSANSIVIGLKRDGRDRRLVAIATEIAKRSKSTLDLVHIMPPMPAYRERFGFSGTMIGGERLRMESGEVLGASPVDSLEFGSPWVFPCDGGGWERQHVDLGDVGAMQAHLEIMADEVRRKGVGCRSHVRFGDFPDALLAAEFQQPGALILVGVTTEEDGFLRPHRRKMSRLFRQTRVPVLAIPDGVLRYPFLKGGFRILIADDLSASSSSILQEAERLLDIVPASCEVMHVHVAPIASLSMTAHPEYQLVAWPSISVEERLVDDRHHRLLEKLRRRGRGIAQAVGRKAGSYVAELWHGQVAEELARASAAFDPHLCVVGSHRALHWDEQGIRRGSLASGPLYNMRGAFLVTGLVA